MRHHRSRPLLLRTALALALAIAPAALASQTPRPADPPLRHGYVDMRYGQLHFSIAQPKTRSARRPVILLHQSPQSSVLFDALVPVLARDRLVIAIDTPGYGNSDAPPSQPTIEDYAAAITDALKAMGYGPAQPVDLFGYHTGAKIATEIAIRNPAMIEAVSLSGIYIKPQAEVDKALASIVHPVSGEAMLTTFAARVPGYVKYYAGRGIPDERWTRLAVASLLPIRKQEWGHEAAFRYTPRFAERLGRIPQPVQFLVMDDGLAPETRNAGKLVGGSVVTDIGLGSAAFFTQADAVAGALRSFFDGPHR